MRNYLHLFFIGLFVFISCKKEVNNIIVSPSKIEFKHQGNLSIINTSNQVITTLEIEFADDDFERQTGLMYRTSMKNNRGMLFVFDKSEMKSFYMKNTYLPLDIIFIDGHKKIINISKNAKPLSEQSILSESPAKYVLEINAGLSNKWNLKPGDSIDFSKL